MTRSTESVLGAPEAPPDPSTISPLWRALLLVVGTASLLLGLVGIVLPVLPTTPFLLVTAACYARASTRLYQWLIGQRSLGPIITEWRRVYPYGQHAAHVVGYMGALRPEQVEDEQYENYLLD